MQTNNLVKKTDNFSVVRDLLERSKDEIAKALPKSITPERVARIALTTLRKNPGLLECDPNSFLGAVMQASQLGFELDDNLGLAYLVPFFNKKTGRKEVQLIIGYRGLIELARRSGKLRSINARIVYENEPFSVEYGLGENLVHKPLPPSKRGNGIIGVYAVASMNDGSKGFEFMWAEELEEIKKSSKAGDSKTSPWATHEEEMMKKTVIRKMMKYLSLSPEAVKATVIDEYGESGINTKDTFLQTETEKQTLGMREPKPIQEKVTQISDYKTNVIQEEKTNIKNKHITETAKQIESIEHMQEEKTEHMQEDIAAYSDLTNEYDVPAWVYDDNLDEETVTKTQDMQSLKTQSEPQKTTNKATTECISDKQISFVNSLCEKKGIYEDQMPELLNTVFGEEINLESLTKKEATILIDYLKEIA